MKKSTKGSKTKKEEVKKESFGVGGWALFGLLVALVSFAFVQSGLKGMAFGFPLDDAWIHQTYARNLIQSGTWSFVPGTVSGGSTSPLWTLILSVGYIFSEQFAWYWTIAVSIISFAAMAVLLGWQLSKSPIIGKKEIVLFLAIFALEWHLDWAAVSGMETIFYSFGIVALFYLLLQEKPRWWLVWGISGALIWLRPDGLTLLGPMLLIVFLGLLQKKIRIKELVLPFLLFVLLALGYLWLNSTTTGHLFPNTFYAKQTEYSELWNTPLLQRIGDEFMVLIVGAGIFLVPGFVYKIYEGIRSRDWKILSFVLWILGFGILYAIRLPVTYQHGRYMIPVIPLFLFIGFMGSMQLLKLIKLSRLTKMVEFAVFAALILVTAIFYAIGLQGYKEDVGVVNALMVEPAQWIHDNTQSSDVIAVHDIGAMGYFSGRSVIDLAGLANPEVIPFIRDEAQIYSFMKSKEAAYFVGLHDWYAQTDAWGSIVKSFVYTSNSTNAETVVVKLK